MSYIFPKRRLRGRDVLDPVELNQDVVPAAENYSGRLNPHNFDADGSYPLSTELNSTYMTPHYVSKTADPDFGDPGSSWTMPSEDSGSAAGSDGSFTMATDIEWQIVESMTLTFTTNQAMLWITGWLQYIWLEYYHSGTAGAAGYHIGYEKGSARVQFAIRVDGRIIEHTITGKNDNFLMSYMPMQWDDEKVIESTSRPGDGSTDASNASAIPGPSTIKVPPAAALGPPAMPIRVGCTVAVSPGSHTVELVCRRLGSEAYRQLGWLGSTDALASFSVLDDYITIFNRKLLAFEIPTTPAVSAVGASVDIKTFKPEDIVSNTTLGTNCVDKLRDAHNAIDKAALGRGVFNNNQLPSAVYDYCQVEFKPGSTVSTNNEYPGAFDSTVATSINGDTGWTIVHDGVSMTAAANLLRSDATHAAAFDATTKKSFILVQANLSFKRLERIGTTPQHDDPTSFGAFALGYHLDGAANPHIINSTVCFVNHHQTMSALTNQAEGAIYENLDIPLLWWIDLRESFWANNIDHIGVYTSVVGHPTGHQAEIEWERGHLMILKLPA